MVDSVHSDASSDESATANHSGGQLAEQRGRREGELARRRDRLESLLAERNFEEAEVELVHVDDLPRLVAEGVISHALVVVAFYWHDLLRRGPGADGGERGPAGGGPQQA